MNDATRAVPEPDADAVERVKDAISESWDRQFSEDGAVSFRELAKSALQAATHGDAVERAAKAIFSCESEPRASKEWGDLYQRTQDQYRDMAAAALQAAAHGDADWLDDALGSISPWVSIPSLGRETDDESGGEYFYATIEWFVSSNSYRSESGTGPTRQAAIIDAVAKAKEASHESQ